MGQGAQRPTCISVGVFEPLLIPKLRGRVFVRVRVLSGDKVLHCQNVEDFPAFLTVPVTGSGVRPNELFSPVLEIQVHTAPDRHGFRTNSKVRHFATVPVPLKSFMHLWQCAQVPGSGASAQCLFLGLDEDLVEADARVGFERARALGELMTAPKLGIVLRGAELDSASSPGGWQSVLVSSACSAAASTASASEPTNDYTKEMLIQADTVIRGLHAHVEEVRASAGDYDALQEENARLRTAIIQQKEKYNGLTTWLRAQVEVANRAPDPVAVPGAHEQTSTGMERETERAKDQQTERAKEQLKDAKELIARLRRDLDSQYANYGSIERHASAAERAKGEALKLFGDWHQDIRVMGVQLADCDIVQDALRTQLLDLTEEVASLRARSEGLVDCPLNSQSTSRHDGSVPPVQWDKAAVTSNDYMLGSAYADNGQRTSADLLC